MQRAHGVFVELAEPIEYPWSFAKLRWLTLGIIGCDLPIEPEVAPYISRPCPITLTQAEAQHFTQLAQLYRQIGALAELRFLDLRMVKLDTRRPGFLHHLAGLKKFEFLEGSVRADAEQTKQTMGWNEVKFMTEYWPHLEHARFFAYKDDVTEPFEWFRHNHKDGQAAHLFGHFRNR
ncbi:hypothetical protein BGW39_005344 [Mortierella sp. 14UC]|nr:hypothetical protein BGW39_005344 [Mortierella sp. 14UC]